MVHILRVIIAFAVSFLCVTGHAGQIYTYSYTFASGDVITGSFHGNGDVHLVTGLSNITAVLNGTEFNRSGNLFGIGQDAFGYVEGGAVASDSLALNRFLFIDSDFPTDTGYTNFFGIMDSDPPIAAYDGFMTYATDDQLVQGRWSLTLIGDDGDPAAVPEPASAVLLLAGIGAIAVTRRKRTFSRAGN